MEDLKNRKYIHWDTQGVEIIPPSEVEYIENLVSKINETQRHFDEENGYCYTATHARTQGIVQGSLKVSSDLPAHLKQTELLASAGDYPVVCR